MQSQSSCNSTKTWEVTTAHDVSKQLLLLLLLVLCTATTDSCKVPRPPPLPPPLLSLLVLLPLCPPWSPLTLDVKVCWVGRRLCSGVAQVSTGVQTLSNLNTQHSRVGKQTHIAPPTPNVRAGLPPASHVLTFLGTAAQ